MKNNWWKLLIIFALLVPFTFTSYETYKIISQGKYDVLSKWFFSDGGGFWYLSLIITLIAYTYWFIKGVRKNNDSSKKDKII
jgi:hypothetical protein